MSSILITGCQGGALRYTTDVLRKCGVAVAYKQAGRRGTVDWRVGVGSPEQYDLVVVQTRDLRKVATSFGMTATNEDWQVAHRWIARRFGASLPHPADHPKETGVLYCFAWYRMLDVWAHHTYQVERLPEHLPRLLELMGVQVATEQRNKALRSNRRGTPEAKRRIRGYWTWQEIEAVAWGKELKALASKLGYEVYT